MILFIGKIFVFKKPTVRLLNPAKTDMGRVSKAILDKIILRVRKKRNLPLWINTKEVISWFERLDDKKSRWFLKIAQIPPILLKFRQSGHPAPMYCGIYYW